MNEEAQEVTREVKVATLEEPKNLTLTRKPANQIGFKIIRNDKEQEMAASKEVRVTRVRAKRSMGEMLAVVFPAGTTEAEAKTRMDGYGIGDYTVVSEGDSVIARRSDLKELPTNVLHIGIGDGVKAVIPRADTPAVEGEKQGLSVVCLRFDKETFADEEAVMGWLERHDVDFLENGVKNGDTVITVDRLSSDDETREIQTEGGVTFVVARADVMDVPEAFVEVVSDTAYGNWGWGHLDFAAAMADSEFCDAGHDAIYQLEDVLRNIMFYNSLPVSVRKELVNRAVAQFGAFIGSLIDALPAKVVMATRSIIESKEKQMTQENKQETPATPEYVTRAELTDVVKAAVTEAIAAQRSDPAPAETAPTEVTAAPAPAEAKDPTVEALAVVTRSMEAMTKSVADMTASMNARMEKLEGATVLRSDNADPAQTTQVKREDQVFAGVFGNLRSK